AEGGQDFLCLLPQRVGDADHGGQLPPYCQIQVRILRRQGIKAFLLALWNDAALILKDKVGAADENLLLIDGACDAVSHQILHLGVVLFVAQAPALGLLHHGVGHGMGEVLLQAGGQPQHFGFLFAAEGHHLSHRGQAWVRVPVLSKTMVSAAATASRNLPPLTVIWARPASRMAERTARGMASFSAQEKSTISTDRARATFRVRAKLMRLPAKV